MPCCEACISSQRERIDAALLAGRPLLALSEEFGVPAATLSGHRAHVALVRRARPSPSRAYEPQVQALLAEMTKTAQSYEAAAAATQHQQHKGGDKT